MACVRCGEPVEAGTSYCPSCGLNLERIYERIEDGTCPKCEVAFADGDCPECGVSREALRAEMPDGFGSGSTAATGADGGPTHDGDGGVVPGAGAAGDRSDDDTVGTGNPSDGLGDGPTSSGDGPSDSGRAQGESTHGGATQPGTATGGRAESSDRRTTDGSTGGPDGRPGGTDGSTGGPDGSTGRSDGSAGRSGAESGRHDAGPNRGAGSSRHATESNRQAEPSRPATDSNEQAESNRAPPESNRRAAGSGPDRGAKSAETRDASQAPTPEQAAAASGKSTHREGMAQDEVYCIACGTIISRRAEMCPDCGMNQVPPGGWDDGSSGQSSSHASLARAEDEKIARKDLNTNVLLGIFLPPIAYLNLGKRLLAVVNLITLNYMLLGFLIVPYHVYAIIRDARHRVLDGGGYR